jgi:hypothetical protein
MDGLLCFVLCYIRMYYQNYLPVPAQCLNDAIHIYKKYSPAHLPGCHNQQAGQVCPLRLHRKQTCGPSNNKSYHGKYYLFHDNVFTEKFASANYQYRDEHLTTYHSAFRRPNLG